MQPLPPDPPLGDGTISLRPWRRADVAAIAAACREDEIARWLERVPQPYTEDDARAYVERSEAGWRDGTAHTLLEAGDANVINRPGAVIPLRPRPLNARRPAGPFYLRDPVNRLHHYRRSDQETMGVAPPREPTNIDPSLPPSSHG